MYFANSCKYFPSQVNDCKILSFTDSDKDLLEKIREHMVGGASIVFTRKPVLDETFFRDSTNWCKSIVGTYASRLYPFSMCQAMPTELYTKWELDSESDKLKRCQNKTRSFEKMVMSYFQRVRPQRIVKSFYMTGTQRN